jgi:hypothetical protein
MPMNTGTCSYIGIRQIMLYCSRTDVPDQSSPPPAQTKQKRLESLAWPRTPAQIPRTRSARTRIHRGSKRIKASALHATQNTVTSDAEQRYRPQNVIRSTKKTALQATESALQATQNSVTCDGGRHRYNFRVSPQRLLCRYTETSKSVSLTLSVQLESMCAVVASPVATYHQKTWRGGPPDTPPTIHTTSTSWPR